MKTEVYATPLYGGVSTQPAQQRFPYQVEDAINAHFSLRNGVAKRPGSRFVSAISSLTSANTYKIAPLVRDETERYLVVYGNGDIRVFEILATGGLLEATVTFSTAATNYFAGAEASQYRLLPISDSTLIARTDVATSSSGSTDFVVTRSFATYEYMVGHTPADETYHSVNSESVIDYYKYDVDGLTFATAKTQVNKWWGWGIPNNTWTSLGNVGFTIGFQRRAMQLTSVSWTESSLTLTKVGAFASYTFRPGDQIYVTNGTNVTVGWYDIVDKTDDTLVLNETITTDGMDHADVNTNSIGREFEVVWTPGNVALMEDRAADIQNQLRNAGAVDAAVEWVRESPYSGHYVITSPYRGSEATITGIGSPSTGYDLTQCVVGYPDDCAPMKFESQTSGTGTLPTEDDDTLPITDRWTQVGAPGQAGASIDGENMPMLMQRTAYTGDGVTPAEFSIDVASWAGRVSGDATSNPLPDGFSGSNTVSAMAYYRGRLVLAMGEYLVFSRVNDLFNFYIEDVAQLADDDRVEVAISSDHYANIAWLVPLRSGLVIFTEAGSQFEIVDRDILTPATISVTPSTRLETYPDIEPKRIGGNLYFIGPKRDSTALYEYYYDDTRVTNQASEVSLHAEGLIPTSILSMAASSDENTLLMLNTGCNTITAYQMAWSGSQKVQSALSRWVFEQSHETVDIACIGGEVYMLVDRGSDAFHVERLHLGIEA